jgi:hypothetical protein
VRLAAFVIVATACSDAPLHVVPREQVALVPAVPKHDVDVLFVIDDSAAVLHLQSNMKAAFPAFIEELARRGPLPNLHIGVVSSDLGTRGTEDTQPGPSIGSGPGSCSGFGKDGVLQTNGNTLVNGRFISDAQNSDGTRATNYTGSLSSAFSALVSLGSSGCGFEQPLEAMRRALDGHPMNAGFLRPDASLAVVTLMDEDDCSFTTSDLVSAETATLGPLQSFRCTRFGVQCDSGGTTTDDMNVLGVKLHCHWRDDSPYLTPRTRYTEFLDQLKADKRDVMFGAIVERSSTLEVESRTPPGGGSAIPALAHGCLWNTEQGPEVADSAIRIDELTRSVVRGRSEDICTSDYAEAMRGFAREIRGMLGDGCLTRDIAVPADCIVVDQTPTLETVIPPCSAARTTECYQLVEDEACTTSHRLRVDVTRSSIPSADTMVAVRCQL